jgi:nucleoside-diphosphate-sugar epimerase
MSVLVTGAGGFVGANLVRRLADEGHDTTAVCRPGGTAWRLEGIAGAVRVEELDVCDGEAVARLFAQAQPEVVLHLATFGAYHWQSDPRRIVETALLGTVNVLEACRAAGCARVVNAGSSSEYGFKDHPPGEEEGVEPNSAYGVAKAAATAYCLHAAGELETVTLRLYSAYGPFEEPARLMPALVACGLRGELPPLVDPDTARDFVAVDDVVRAFMLAAFEPLPQPGCVYNVGSGRQTSIRELAELATGVFGIDREPRFGTAEPRAWDTSTWVASIDRIEAELGWRPELSLKGGLRGMADWMRSQPALWERYAA